MPAEAEMDLDFSCWGAVPSFEFAFNSENFSDRVLQLEVVACDDVGGQSHPDSAHGPKEKADKGQSIDSSSTMAGTAILTVKTLHINSAILAARSLFFLKLFSNGMKESHQILPRIRISDSDKFEVLSCMRHCSQLLTSLPMTTEFALLYLEHRCSTSVIAGVQLLIDAAKEFLANKYKVLTRGSDELMCMPLAGIKAIISSSDLQVRTEDDVYTFLLEWAEEQYPESKERHRIWTSHLLPLVRFSHMTWRKLQEVLASTDDDVDHEQTTKRITDVLLHKAYPAHRQDALAEHAATCLQVPQRAYDGKSLKVVEFDHPCQQVIVYLDLTREECTRLSPTRDISSQAFHLAGLNFVLIPNCECDEKSKLYSFGLFFASIEPWDPKCLTLDYEFAARTRPSVEFVRMMKERVTYTSAFMEGCDNLFGVEWSKFIADDNLFIDGVLHLRADIRVVEGQLESQT